MLALRAAPREDSGVSAAELVYGAPLALPQAVLVNNIKPHLGLIPVAAASPAGVEAGGGGESVVAANVAPCTEKIRQFCTYVGNLLIFRGNRVVSTQP
jgi:hypothetical protein